MNAYLKHAQTAVVTAAAVLLVIYVARKAPVISGITGPLVNKALMG